MAASVTRQLDYYQNMGVSESNYSGASKQYNGVIEWWRLRTADFNYNDDFYIVGPQGNWYASSAYFSDGISPAFQIG